MSRFPSGLFTAEPWSEVIGAEGAMALVILAGLALLDQQITEAYKRLADTRRSIIAFGEDPSGEVYIGDTDLGTLSDKDLTVLRRTRIGLAPWRSSLLTNAMRGTS